MRKINERSLAKLTNPELVCFLTLAGEASEMLPENVDRKYIADIESAKNKLEGSIDALNTTEQTKKLKWLMREMIFHWQYIKAYGKFSKHLECARQMNCTIERIGDIRKMNIFEKASNLKILATQLTENHADAVEQLMLAYHIGIIESDCEKFSDIYNERENLIARMSGVTLKARLDALEKWHALAEYINSYQIIFKVELSDFVNNIEYLQAKIDSLKRKKRAAKEPSAQAPENPPAQAQEPEPEATDDEMFEFLL